MHAFFRHFALTLRGHKTLTLILFAGLTLLGGFFTLHSRVDNSLSVWQSADDPHWLQYQKFVAQYHIIDPLIAYLPGLGLLELEETADALKEHTSAASFHTLSITSLTGTEAGLFFILPKAESSPSDLATLLSEVEHVLQRKRQNDRIFFLIKIGVILWPT